ncbi:hypothetical protein Tco_0425715 [Tanacetum coccineum]
MLRSENGGGEMGPGMGCEGVGVPGEAAWYMRCDRGGGEGYMDVEECECEMFELWTWGYGEMCDCEWWWEALQSRWSWKARDMNASTLSEGSLGSIWCLLVLDAVTTGIEVWALVLEALFKAWEDGVVGGFSIIAYVVMKTLIRLPILFPYLVDKYAVLIVHILEGRPWRCYWSDLRQEIFMESDKLMWDVGADIYLEDGFDRRLVMNEWSVLDVEISCSNLSVYELPKYVVYLYYEVTIQTVPPGES